jgi:mannosyltransferase
MRGTVAALAALTGVAVVLRLGGFDESLYGDELFTLAISSESNPADMLDGLLDSESVPPLHYVLAWIARRGIDAKHAIRLPSLVLGAATIPLAYLLVRRVFGRPPALFAAAFLAISPFAVFYASEARAYATLVFLVIVSTLSLLRALDGGAGRWWVLHAAASCAALYVHYTAVFVLAAQAAWVIWARPEHRRAAFLANAAVVVGFLPWLPWLVEQSENESYRFLEAANPLTLDHLREAGGRLVLGHPLVEVGDLPGTLAAAVFLLAAGTAVAFAVARHPRIDWRGEPALLLLLAVATPLGLVAYAIVGPSLLAPRNMIASLPSMAACLGAALALAGRAVGTAAAGAMLGVLALGAVQALGDDRRRPPYEQAARVVDAQAGPGDPVVQVRPFGIPGPPGRGLEVNLRRAHPLFEVTYESRGGDTRVVADPRAWRVAERQGQGRVVVFASEVFGRLLLPQPPPGFRLVARRELAGIERLDVLTYAAR